MKLPELAIFDLGGVVIHNWQTLGRIARLYRLDEEKLYADYLSSDAPLMEGTLSTKGWWLHICDKFSLPAEARSSDPLYDQFHCYADGQMLAFIGQVKQLGVRVVCGSNTCAPHWEKMRAAGSLTSLFDACYLSHELHIRKPDDEFFLAILHREGATPAGTVFTDDTKENVDAASRLGIDALWYHSDSRWSGLDRLRLRFGLLT